MLCRMCARLQNRTSTFAFSFTKDLFAARNGGVLYTQCNIYDMSLNDAISVKSRECSLYPLEFMSHGPLLCVEFEQSEISYYVGIAIYR